MGERSFLFLLVYSAFTNAGVLSVRSPSINQNRIDLSSTPKPRQYVLNLTNNGNVEYFGDITFGKQTLPAIYDTGSFEPMTISTLCKSCNREGAVYNRNKSSTFDPGEKLYTVHHFGSGPVLGSKGEETVRIGGLESPLVAKSVSFWEVVRHEIPMWEKSEFVAIVGLGMTDQVPIMNPDKKNVTPDDTLLQKLHIDEFSICFGRGNYAKGSLSFGPQIASMKTQDFFTPIPVVGKIHWGVEMTRWGPGDFNPCEPSCGVIIDSGTSFIALSPKALEAMSGLLHRIQGDCSNLHELPDLTFDLGGKDFTLPPSAYVMEVLYGEAMQVSPRRVMGLELLESSKRKLSSLRAQGLKRVCISAFKEIDIKTQYGPMMILGMPFLRHFYTIFDRAEKKIYTAPSSESCSPLGAESFVLKRNHTGRGRLRRTSLDEQPTPADLTHARIGFGLMSPNMPRWMEL